MAKILFVDDEDRLETVVQQWRRDGHTVEWARSKNGAIVQLKSQEFDVAVVDLLLPEQDREQPKEQKAGAVVIREGRKLYPDMGALAVSANVPPDLAGEFSRLVEADAFIEVGSDGDDWYEELNARLAEAIKERDRVRERHKGIERLFDDESVMAELRKVAGTRKTVLLRGETGTGKGHFARRLAELCGCAQERFKQVNCAALGEHDAVHGALFGLLPSIFTDVGDIPGLFELLGPNDVLLLDEIDKLTIVAQGAMLDLLDRGKFQRFPFCDAYPLPPGLPKARKDEEEARLKERFPDLPERYRHGYGLNEVRQFRGRLILASNAELDQLVDGALLPDFYNRIAGGFSIKIKPLRERGRGYVKEKAEQFLGNDPDARTKRLRGFAAPAIKKLEDHDWRTGNVRELLHAVDGAVVRAKESGYIAPDDIVLLPAPRGSKRRYKFDLSPEGERYAKLLAEFDRDLLNAVAQLPGVRAKKDVAVRLDRPEKEKDNWVSGKVAKIERELGATASLDPLLLTKRRKTKAAADSCSNTQDARSCRKAKMATSDL